MRAFLVAVAAMMVLTGCQKQVSDPTAIPEPRKLDCDLIFPPASVDP